MLQNCQQLTRTRPMAFPWSVRHLHPRSSDVLSLARHDLYIGSSVPLSHAPRFITAPALPAAALALPATAPVLPATVLALPATAPRAARHGPRAAHPSPALPALLGPALLGCLGRRTGPPNPTVPLSISGDNHIAVTLMLLPRHGCGRVRFFCGESLVMALAGRAGRLVPGPAGPVRLICRSRTTGTEACLVPASPQPRRWSIVVVRTTAMLHRRGCPGPAPGRGL